MVTLVSSLMCLWPYLLDCHHDCHTSKWQTSQCHMSATLYMQLHSNKSMYLAWIAIAVNILCLHCILKGNKPIRVVYVCIAVRCSYSLGKVQVELPQTALTLTSDLLKKCITLPAPFKLGRQQISPLVEC